MKILVLQDPHPNIQEPWFVKDAYVGLLLGVARAYTGKRASSTWPGGAYMVTLNELLAALKRAESKKAAYTWFLNEYKEIDKELTNKGGYQFLFPASCCEEIPDRLHS